MPSVVLQHGFVELGKSDFSHDYHLFGQAGSGKCVNLCSLLMAHGLHCLRRHLQLISVNVEPGSKSIFSNFLGLIKDSASTSMILVGARRLLMGILVVSGTMVSDDCSSLTNG